MDIVRAFLVACLLIFGIGMFISVHHGVGPDFKPGDNVVHRLSGKKGQVIGDCHEGFIRSHNAFWIRFEDLTGECFKGFELEPTTDQLEFEDGNL
jgi:hypothetical protein